MKTENIYHRKWHILSAVGTGVFLATVDGSIVNVSLPTMVTSLNTNFTVIQWVVLAYLLTVTTLILGFGRLADILGKQHGFTDLIVLILLPASFIFWLSCLKHAEYTN